MTSTRLLDQDALAARSASSSAWRAASAAADPAPGLADPLAGVGLGRRRQGADLAVGQRQRALVAGVGQPGAP